MAQYPFIGGGTQIDDELMSAMLDNYIIKPADSPARVVNTLVADPDLTFPVIANAIYDVEFVLRFGALQAAGFRTTWSVPAGTTGNKLCAGPGSANAIDGTANITEMRWALHGYATAANYTNPRNSITSTTWVWEKALLAVGGTAGSVTLQWGQLTTNATGTVVNANSYVKYRRIA